MTFKEQKGCLIVDLSGEIDHHCAEAIRNEIDSRFERAEAKNMIFDFTNVEFMDSSGIGLILGRYKTVAQRGGKAAITGATKYVERILDMSGVFKVIKKYKKKEDALKEI